MMKLSVKAFLLIIIGVMCVRAEEKADTFCTLEEATVKMLEAADIDLSKIASEDKDAAEMIKREAEDIVLNKMVENPGKVIRIKWADIYDLRGMANMILCQRRTGFSSALNCTGAMIDAAGKGITGTTAGNILTTLTLNGPKGFVLALSLYTKIKEETFQCKPSIVRMFAHGAVEFAMYLPVCKVGVINRACVSVQNQLKSGVEEAIRHMFGEDVLRATEIAAAQFYSTEGGKQVVKILLKPIKAKVKESAVNGIDKLGKEVENFSKQIGNQGYQGQYNVPVPLPRLPDDYSGGDE